MSNQPDWIKVIVTDIRPDGTPVSYPQMWAKEVCRIQGGIAQNTHTGKSGKVDRIYTEGEGGFIVNK